MAGGGSHFNLFVNGRGKVELGERLPFLRSADAVIGQLLHGHPVDAFRVPDPVVHLQGGRDGIRVKGRDRGSFNKRRHPSSALGIVVAFCGKRDETERSAEPKSGVDLLCGPGATQVHIYFKVFGSNWRLISAMNSTITSFMK